MTKIMRDRIAYLEGLVDELQERIRQLESLQLGADWMPPVELRLTMSEAAILGALMARDRCSKDVLLEATRTSGLGYRRDEVEAKIVDVFVCKLRRKLEPFGIEITTLWGYGYSLDEVARNRLLTWDERTAA